MGWPIVTVHVRHVLVAVFMLTACSPPSTTTEQSTTTVTNADAEPDKSEEADPSSNGEVGDPEVLAFLSE